MPPDQKPELPSVPKILKTPSTVTPPARPVFPKHEERTLPKYDPKQPPKLNVKPFKTGAMRPGPGIFGHEGHVETAFCIVSAGRDTPSRPWRHQWAPLVGDEPRARYAERPVKPVKRWNVHAETSHDDDFPAKSA
jgi:hypothetical protein